MRLNDRASDREPKARAAGIPVARGFDPEERRESGFAKLDWNSRSVIDDPDEPLGLALLELDHSAFPVDDGVLDQVADGAAQRQRAAGEAAVARSGKAHRSAGVGDVVDEAVDKNRKVEARP